MFITESDYNATIHAEILTAITRNDSTILPIIEDRAVEEMKGYLVARYDTNNIFNKTGTARNPIIVQFLLDIIIYNLHSIHNPAAIPEIRVTRYERAITWLKDVMKGLINPGLPELDDAKGAESHVHYGSNPKRGNHY